jgi:hypothetical protein
MNNVIIQVSTTEHTWQNGIWNLTVTNELGDSVWVNGFAWDGQWETSHLIFTTARDSGHTISSPATADFAVAVAAYNEGGSDILPSSSRGPRIDGFPKPTIAAPGSDIRAALNSVSILWDDRDGTSMASPHVAGVLALIRQASGGVSAWLDYSALVNGAGGQSSHYESPSTSWGHGLADALWSVRQVLDSPSSDGSLTSDWFDIEELFSDSIDTSVKGGHDITSTRFFLDNDTIGLTISLRSNPDFEGSDVLKIEWDNDSNVGTGQNGADLVVNITGGASEVYEWNGSDYIVSSLLSDWWEDSTSIILRIEGVTAGSRGSISVSTHNSTMANIDQAGPGALTDYLPPVMDDLWMEFNGEEMIVHVSVDDRDSLQSQTNVAWSIVNGPLQILNSSMRVGASDFTIVVSEDLISSPYLNSLSINITSEGSTLILPLILLSTQIGPQLSFSLTTLDRAVVRVGLLMNDLITGQLVLNGFSYASSVYIGFNSKTGSWLNFSLSSNNGVYVYEVSPTYFQLGLHDVYAVAIGFGVPGTEVMFATLTVVQDYTVLGLAATALIVGGVITIILRQRRGEEV